ncbi:hypothetical protein UCH007_07890 [Dehalococcoides sp. UCH007]|nr:hypothetical protein UCH007_07890 [Dehalococcoides sp. UCH007]
MKRISGILLILLGFIIVFLGGILHITGILKWFIFISLIFVGWELVKRKTF